MKKYILLILFVSILGCATVQKYTINDIVAYEIEGNVYIAKIAAYKGGYYQLTSKNITRWVNPKKEKLLKINIENGLISINGHIYEIDEIIK